MTTLNEVVNAIHVWEKTGGIPGAVKRFNRLLSEYAAQEDIDQRTAKRIALAAYERQK